MNDETKPETTSQNEAMVPIRMVYQNYAGKVSLRHILPYAISWGSNQWHPEPQWLLHALDVDKGDYRAFAFRDCRFLAFPAVDVEREAAQSPLSLASRLMERDNSRIGKFGPLFHNRDGAEALDLIYSLREAYRKAVNPTEEMIELAAFRMWHSEAVRAGTPSMVKSRTPEAFANEDTKTRKLWRDYAMAALSVRS